MTAQLRIGKQDRVSLPHMNEYCSIIKAEFFSRFSIIQSYSEVVLEIPDRMQ
jgi:hypothetical protein